MKEITNKKTIEKFLDESKFESNFTFPIRDDIHLFQFDAGDYIVKAKETPTFLYYMVKGSAKFYLTSPNGKTNLIDFFKEGSFIGEVELIDKELDAKSVQTVKDSWCLALPFEAIKEKALNDTLFLTKVCLYSFKKNDRNNITTMQNQSFKLENRFAHFILLSSNEHIYSEKHTLTSQYLGVSYRHLLQVLSEFIDKGYLVKEDKVYRLLDTNALYKLAEDLFEENLI